MRTSIQFRIFTAIAVFLVLVSGSVNAAHRQDEILIKYKPGRQLQTRAKANTINARVTQSLDKIRYQRLKLPQGLTVEQAIAKFKNDPNVEYVGPNHIIRPCLEPNDDFYQNGLLISIEILPGYFYEEYFYQWWLSQSNGIDAIRAWDIHTGADSDIIIAIVDSGIKADHEDLAGKIIPGYNAILDDDPADTYDDVGHGTEVAGVAAAMTDNEIGMAGVCWGGKLMPVKIIKITGEDEWGLPIASGNDADGAAGIIWAADHGAKIINMSFGGYLADVGGSESIIQDAVNYAWSQGCVLVGGSGNDDMGGVGAPFYPACYDSVIAVGASDEDRTRCDANDWGGGLFGGGASNFGPWLDVVAPGNNMLSTVNMDPGYGCGYYDAGLAGTSFATPVVSGVAALLWSKYPTWTNAQIVNQIKMTSSDIEAPGWDQYTGYGLVNAYSALAMTHENGIKIGQLSSIASSNQVMVINGVITSGSADLIDRLYIEQEDRACGIMLPFSTMPAGFAEGDRVDVFGTMATINGERAIQNANISKIISDPPQSTQPLKPIGFSTKLVGGSRHGFNSGITNGKGTNNIGLLVTVYGKITASGWTYFYIDDGAKKKDGSGFTGLKIISNDFDQPLEGKYVRVTGISSIERPSANVSIPVIRVRRQADIQTLK
ncbi:MAG: S8 family serine peptidase [Armatimonadetes bacterium]|nr:S8 family serine peptidase [Armatimonadota bacterium]